MLHRLLREQLIPAPAETVWEFFCDPRNLNELTPPDMNFEILRGGETAMYAGQLIEYRVEFVPGWRSPWLTEIAHVRPCEYFVDEQRLGPYHFWYHEHEFAVRPQGTRMTDRVSYVVPLGPPGDLLNQVWIGRRLAAIFGYRRQKIIDLFGEAT